MILTKNLEAHSLVHALLCRYQRMLECSVSE